VRQRIKRRISSAEYAAIEGWAEGAKPIGAVEIDELYLTCASISPFYKLAVGVPTKAGIPGLIPAWQNRARLPPARYRKRAGSAIFLPQSAIDG
jgi:hypothetical protein